MKIVIIGCGNMGKLCSQQLSANHTLFLYDRNQDKIQDLEKKGFGTACSNLQQTIQQAEIVILAIKPQGFKDFVHSLDFEIPSDKMIVSLLAGTTLKALRKSFISNQIVRMMPNLAIACGEGLIGLCVDKPLSETEKNHLQEICKPLGKVYWLEEKQFDAFTSLAGSGPAFVYAMLKAMIDAGTNMGIPSEIAAKIALQMAKGSLTHLEISQKDPDELIKQITSPNGTTIAGLNKFNELSVGNGIKSTFSAAYERAKELSDNT